MSASVEQVALSGPSFGSYDARDVLWLLTDISDVVTETTGLDRESSIQSGESHYSESLPIEFEPSAEYSELFAAILERTARSTAHAVAVLAEQLYSARAAAPVLVSLARAGTPVGILVKRWIEYAHGTDPAHYTISIIRDRGIDVAALDYILDRHDPASLVFVDGWTGKGAIAGELSRSLGELARERGSTGIPSAELGVLSDPAGVAAFAGTRDDLLIASSCLNSTVSGLVSRTVLNRSLIGPRQFHGAKFYRTLASADRSADFLAAVTSEFPMVSGQLVAGSERGERSLQVEHEIERIAVQHRVGDRNHIKPGLGETVRVLLRRVPEKILVREYGLESLEHVELLAAQRGVPVVEDPRLLYDAVGIIRTLGGDS